MCGSLGITNIGLRPRLRLQSYQVEATTSLTQGATYPPELKDSIHLRC